MAHVQADAAAFVRLHGLRASEVEDAGMLADMAVEAENFLRAHRWCRTVRQGYLVDGVGGIFALFYFEIEPDEMADDAVWIIVGDVPPIYLDLVSCATPADAVSAYLEIMQEWVERVKTGQSLEEIVPVYYRSSVTRVNPTHELAAMLEGRVQFIKKEILPFFMDGPSGGRC